MKEKQAIYILVLVSVIWGINFVVGKILTDQFSPIFLVSMRLLVTSIFLVPYAVITRQLKKVNGTDLLLLAVIGVVGIFLNQIIFFYGLSLTSVANSSLISALTPLATTFLAWMFLKEMITGKKIAGAILGIIGVTFLLFEGNNLALSTNTGDLLTFAAMLIWSVAIIMTKRASITMDAITITVYTTLIGALLMNSVNAWQWFAGKNTISLEPWAWVLLVATAITSQGIGFILWNKSLIVLGAGTSSMFMNIPPFVAILTGFFVLNQPILFTQIGGGALIIGGVILANYNKRRHDCAMPEAEKTSVLS